ncbi:MAG: galactose mutarotase [Acidobacteria bacterium]|nr:galactose mutarotase [Acidobacteriota bacterium]
MSTAIEKSAFGKMPDGTPIQLYTLQSEALEARVITYGGILVSLKVPDRNGNFEDVVLGFETLAQYVEVFNSDANPYFGAIIGRYANRIARGRFTLDGKTYSVPVNNGPNSLHGGPRGFHNVVWQAQEIDGGVELKYLSRDGEEGYPGNLEVSVRYVLENAELRIAYSAGTDQPTVANLTQHSYFNLAGQGCGNILDHELRLAASRFTPVDSTLIPTGELKPVDSTPFDFRNRHRIGERIDSAAEQLRIAGGYDHNWVLNEDPGSLREAAQVFEPHSGRVLTVLTTQPGVQFYSGNFLDGKLKGKQGKIYPHRGGLCLETQHFPDSPNHPQFPSTLLRPGERYQQETVFRFSTA